MESPIAAAIVRPGTCTKLGSHVVRNLEAVIVRVGRVIGANAATCSALRLAHPREQ